MNVDPSTNNNTDRETDDDQATPNTVISLSSLNFIEICTEWLAYFNSTVAISECKDR